MGKQDLLKGLTKESLNRILTHPYYAECMKFMNEKVDEFLQSDPPYVTYTAMEGYYRGGSRDPYSKIYWDYTGRVSRFLFKYIETGDDIYVEKVKDLVWNICGWESWSNVAHIAEDLPLERRRIYLDLSSTALSHSLCLVVRYMGDKLPPLVLNRLKASIRERTIDSYRDNDNYWWMRCKLNWAAVCTSNIMAVYMYEATEEELEEQLPRMLKTLECYVEGFDEEGCCAEGYGYWNYGFSHYCLAGELLLEYTDGKINLFDNPKIHKIALFQQNAAINDKQTIPFSDGGFTFAPNAPLSHFLKKKYPDVEIPDIEYGKTSASIRDMLWADPDLVGSKMNPKSNIYIGTQWFIYRSENYNLACKGGYNNEPHNHNDIGSFVISKGGVASFTDGGGGEYTKQYFDPPTRYSHLVTSSYGHSVPIINGEGQVTGNRKSEIIRAVENNFTYTLHNGYEIEGLETLVRDFNCLEDGVVITDSYKFSKAPDSVVERFISTSEPEITEEGIKVENNLLTFDKEVFEATVTSELVWRPGHKQTPLYLTDLKVKRPTAEFSVSVKIV